MMKPIAAFSPRKRLPAEAYLWLALGALGVLVFAGRFTVVDWGGSHWEQSGVGTLATALVDGLAAPVKDYQHAAVAGSVLFGLVLYPFYALFGPSFFVQKIVSAAMAAGGIVFWTLAVRRAWGKIAAAMFFLWFIFPPPFLEWHLHQSWGFRTEGLLFSGLLLFWFVRLGATPQGFFGSFGLGLLAGLASYFVLENLAVSAALAATAVWLWGRAGVRKLLSPAALGFLCALSMAFVAIGLPPALADLWAGRAAAAGPGWLDLFHRVLPKFAGYGGPVGSWLSAAWCALAGLGFVLAARIAVRRKTDVLGASALAVFLVGHVFFFLLAYGLSTMKIPAATPSPFYDMRYLYTIAPTMLALAVFFLLRLHGAWRWLVFLPFLVGGAVNVAKPGDVTLGDFRLVERMRALRGDNYLLWIENNSPRHWTTEKSALTCVQKIPRRWRAAEYRRLGRWLQSERPRGRATALLNGGEPLSADARRNIAIGVGAELAGSLLPGGCSRVAADEPQAVTAPLETLDREAATGCAIGAGLAMRECIGLHRCDACDDAFASFAPLFCGALPQLDASECRQWMIYGDALGGVAGDADEMRMLDRSIWRCGPLAEGVSREAAVAALRRGYSEKLAAELATTYRRVHVDFPMPELREAFARMGINLRPTGGPHQYLLEILP